MLNGKLRTWLCVIVGLLLAHPAAAQERLKGTILLNTSALKPGAEHVAAVVFEIADKFHVQSHKPIDEFAVPFQATMVETPGLSFGPVQYPPGIVHEYRTLGKVSVYEKRSVLFVPLRVDATAKPGPVTLSARLSYQLCDDQTCFAPEEKLLSVNAEVVAAGQEVSAANAEVFKEYRPATTRPATRPGASAVPNRVGQSSIIHGNEYRPSSLLGAFSLAFLVGIIFNVMPCVLPVLPMKIIGFYEVAQHDRRRTLFFAGIFSLGVVSVFVALALLVPVFRVFTWGEQFSNPWFLWFVVVLMLAMALAMFGLFSFVLPTSVYNLSPRHDTSGGNFFWGVLTAAFSTPCTAPLFPPLLLWASSQPAGIGIGAVAMVGVGMSFPYLVLSAFPEAMRSFPRVGPWSELIKQTTGFILLGFAAYFAAGRLLQAPLYWWAPLPVAAAGSFWLVFRSVRISPRPLAAVISLAIGLFATGSVAALAMHMSGRSFIRSTPAVEIVWKPYSDDAFNEARRGNEIVLIKFTASWCLNCQFVEASVFHNASVAQLLKEKKVVALKADLTAKDAAGWPHLRKLNPTGGIPLTAVYAPDREEPVQLAGVYRTEDLVVVIRESSHEKSGSDGR